MVRVIATLRDKITGKTVRHEYDTNQDRDGIEFDWLDNNFACDCNRSLFMYGDERDGMGFDCNTNRIQLVSLTADGVELEHDDECTSGA